MIVPDTSALPELSPGNQIPSLLVRCDSTQSVRTAQCPCGPTNWDTDLGVRAGAPGTLGPDGGPEHAISHLGRRGRAPGEERPWRTALHSAPCGERVVKLHLGAMEPMGSVSCNYKDKDRAYLFP